MHQRSEGGKAMKKPLLQVVFLVALATAIGGCAGGRGALAFDTLQYPVSSSGVIYGPDDRPYNIGELQVVGKMAWVERIWGLWWSWIPLTGTIDVSAPINAQIQRVNGDGIVNLNVKVENCGMNYIPVLNIIPFYPGCAFVTIMGDIVRMPDMPQAPQGQPPAAPPASFIPKDKVQQAISARMAKLMAAR